MVKSNIKHEQGKRKNHGGGGAANRGMKKGQGALRAGSAMKNSSSAAKVGRTAPNGEKDLKGSHFRSENTIKRLNMYNKKLPNKHKMREQALGPARIQPDRRWFGNTRVIAQDKMQAFRETIAKGVDDPFSVVLKGSKLPMSLLRDTEGKASRMDLLSISPFTDVFSKRRGQKKPKLGSCDLEGLLQRADEKAAAYDGDKDEVSKVDSAGHDRLGEADVAEAGHRGEEIFNKGTSRRIWGELWKVVDSSDIIVEVLDARDPMGTRCYALEKEIRKNRSHKHIVLLLNKVDLVPTWVSRRWMQILMKEFPTLAFHASINNPFGKNSLLNLLRQFSNLLKEKKHVTIGMIGYPNVGKSSVVNTLRRKKVCKAAPVPGETKVWQYISLTKRLYLLDCPGIVPSTANDFAADSAKVLKGSVRAERINTPCDYIDEVLSRVKKQYLLQRYKLPEDTTWEDAEEFLTILGRKMGKLQKGGEPDLDTAARIVLYDWQRGRIPYFCAPPMEDDAGKTKSSSSKGGAGEAVPALENAAAADEAAPGAIVVSQSLEDLNCSLDYDKEDLKGQLPKGEGGEVRGRAAKAKAKGKRDRSSKGGADAAARTEDGTPAGEGTTLSQAEAKRRKTAQSSGSADQPAGSGRNRQALGSRGSVDWKAVVAEFG